MSCDFLTAVLYSSLEEIAPKSIRSGCLLVRDRGGFVFLVCDGDLCGRGGVNACKIHCACVYYYQHRLTKEVNMRIKNILGGGTY